MTALLLHTALTVVLIGWAYMITSRIPYRPAWIWSGTALVALVGYVAILARSVFEGSPARVQAIVGDVGAILLLMSGIVCFVLYAAVSRGSRVTVAARGAAGADGSGWAPRNEDPVILPDDAEDWDSGSVIDVGTSPTGSDAEDVPRGGRYAYPAADEPEPASTTPARSTDVPVAPHAAPSVVPQASQTAAPPAAYPAAPPAGSPATYPAVAPAAYPAARAAAYPAAPPAAPGAFTSAAPVASPPASPFAPPPTSPVAPPATSPVAPPATSPVAPAPATPPVAPAPATPPATAMYQPVAPPPVAASEWSETSSPDEDSRVRIAPRRAMPSPSDLGD